MIVDLTVEEMNFISKNIDSVLKSMAWAAVCEEHLTIKRKFIEAARLEEKKASRQQRKTASGNTAVGADA